MTPAETGRTTVAVPAETDTTTAAAEAAAAEAAAADAAAAEAKAAQVKEHEKKKEQLKTLYDADLALIKAMDNVTNNKYRDEVQNALDALDAASVLNMHDATARYARGETETTAEGARAAAKELIRRLGEAKTEIESAINLATTGRTSDTPTAAASP